MWFDDFSALYLNLNFNQNMFTFLWFMRKGLSQITFSNKNRVILEFYIRPVIILIRHLLQNFGRHFTFLFRDPLIKFLFLASFHFLDKFSSISISSSSGVSVTIKLVPSCHGFRLDFLVAALIGSQIWRGNIIVTNFSSKM